MVADQPLGGPRLMAAGERGEIRPPRRQPPPGGGVDADVGHGAAGVVAGLVHVVRVEGGTEGEDVARGPQPVG